MAERPDRPETPADLQAAIGWAAGFFGVAMHMNLGLDEGQSVMLAEVVRRLDQIESELLHAS